MTPDLRVEADGTALIELKLALYDEAKSAGFSDELDLQEDTEVRVGEHGEPMLIGLVVALGGAELTRQVFRTVRRWMEHRERMKELDTVQLSLTDTAGTRRVSLKEIEELATSATG